MHAFRPHDRQWRRPVHRDRRRPAAVVEGLVGRAGESVYELEALIDGIARPRPAARRPVTGSSRGRGGRCAADSGSAGAFARSHPPRPRTGRTGPRSRWVCSTRTGRHPGSRPSNQPTRDTAGDPPTCSQPNSRCRRPCARRGSTRRRSASTRQPSTASAWARRNSRQARPPTTAPSTRRRPMSPSSLRLGANRLEIELSDGWYRGQVGAFRMPAGWGTMLGARVELHIEHTDGTRRIIRSDDTWTSSRSTIVRADLMDGQTVDFTAEEGDPEPVLVGAVEAPDIDWSPAPPVRVVESRTPRSIREIEDGRVGRRLRPERVRLDPPDGPRPRGHAPPRSTTASTSASTET